MHFTTRLRKSLLLLPILSLGVLSGCGRSDGPELGQVEGIITINNEPASQVMIEFQPQEPGGSPSFGFADDNGRYRLKFSGTRSGALIGTHTIRVMFDDDPSPDSPPPEIKIPAKYNKKSELTAEVFP